MTLVHRLSARLRLADPQRRRTLERVALGVLVAVYAGTFVKGVRGTLDKNDGYDFYVAARALVEGRDPTEAMLSEIGYLAYPPSQPFLFAPLAVFGHVGYALLWNGINAALVFAAPALALGVVTGRVRGHPLWWYLLPAVVGFRVLETNAGLSQSNLFVGGWCLAGMYGLRRGWPVRAGLAIAVGAAIKLTPGVFGVYFLWRRRWRAAAAALAGAALLFVLLPVATHGGARTVEQYRAWRSYVRHWSYPEGQDFDYMHGQSVQAALLRLLTKSNARKPEKGEYYVNVADWDRERVRRAALPIGVGVLLGVLAVSRNPVGPREAVGPYLEMALLLVAILYVSPYVRKAHYAVMYPALCVAIGALLSGRLAGPPARRLAWSIGAFAVAINGTGPAIVTKAGSEFFNAICIYLWATVPFALALAGAVVACRRQTTHVDDPHALANEDFAAIDARSADA